MAQPVTRERVIEMAVDILETIREHELTMSSSIVGYFKMLVTLGTLRHELAVAYDLPSMVRRFVRGLARQQSGERNLEVKKLAKSLAIICLFCGVLSGR